MMRSLALLPIALALLPRVAWCFDVPIVDRERYNDAVTACTMALDEASAWNACIEIAYAVLNDDAHDLARHAHPRGIRYGHRALSAPTFIGMLHAHQGPLGLLGIREWPYRGRRIFVSHDAAAPHTFLIVPSFGCGVYPAIEVTRIATGSWYLSRIRPVTLACD